MSSVTPPRAGARTRSALVSAVAVVLLVAAAGCTGGDDDGGDPKGGSGGSASGATDTAPVATVTTLRHLGKSISTEKRDRVKQGVNTVIDAWFDGAFLGDFPRSDYAAAFSGFTEGAAQDAEGRDLTILSNQGINGEIDSATATKRRVHLDVFAHDGHPRGATAHFVLDFDLAGDLDGSKRVTGALYLSKDKGEWKIFGYDVDQAVDL